MSVKRPTVKQVVDAIRKNGYIQVYGTFQTENAYMGNNRYARGGCAVGQAAWNLGVKPVSLADALDTVLTGRFLSSVIYDFNDNQKLPLPEIADELEKIIPPDKMSKRLVIERAS